MNRPTDHVVAELAELGAKTGSLARQASRHIGSNATRYRIQQLTRAHQDVLEAFSVGPVQTERSLRFRFSGWLLMLKASLAPQPEQVYLRAMSDCQRRFKSLTQSALQKNDLHERCGNRARKVIERSLGELDHRLQR